MKLVSPSQAVSLIPANSTIFIHSVVAAPSVLINALMERAGELCNMQIVQIHTEGPAPYADPAWGNTFRTTCFFVGSNLRQAVAEGRADYAPVFLSEVPGVFRSRTVAVDVALIQVSPPDRHGYVSLGTSVDISLAAIESARLVIAQVNPHMPRTHGDGIIPVSMIHYGVEAPVPLHEVSSPPITAVESAIGRNVASLVEDGATLQMGIGSIPDATLSFLTSHRDLGIHTEMFSEGVIDLAEKGVITGAKKKVLPHKIVGSFLMGTRRLYDFVHDNPSVMMLESSFVNDTSVIRQNPRVTAINSAIEVDITGQVCADSIGTRHYSGIGGQMDFMRGATLSEGGKAIIAMPSTTTSGVSRITATLNQGAGVVTTRGHVRYVVTEYGVAELYAKPLRERARALIAIAHPDHRETLERQALERYRVLGRDPR
jgi:4-hydroxybutyrate CoA-transferase